MSPEKRESAEFSRGQAQHGQTHWFGRIRRRVRDSRGIALVTVLYIIFAIGMMLFAFGFMMQGEANFAALNRNSTIALSLAEAGIQEALQRIQNTTAVIPGTTPPFTNSLAGAGNAVTYQYAVQNNPQLFPILSVATYAGTQRAVRIYEQRLFKPGYSNVVEMPQINNSSNYNDVKGDVYSLGNITFQSNTIQCSTGATATNLIPSQVLAGTQIIGSGAGINPGCGATAINGTFTYECSTVAIQNTEVAPTPCARTNDGNGNNLAVHMHPMVPVGMSRADFNAVMTAPALLPPTVSVVQATQNNGVVVNYNAISNPPYWNTSTGRAPAPQVQLIVANAPFCVQASPPAVQYIPPPYTAACLGGYNRYGNLAAGIPHPVRYLDWGLVQDDNTRLVATTFFQSPACTAPCANPGNQNGIRYIPLVPAVNISAEACKVHLNPGMNVFDKEGAIDCTGVPGITQIQSYTVTFSGTKSNPEALVIDNPSAAVTITGSLPGNGLTCTPASNFDPYNWGFIMASGDLNWSSDFVLSGFIYTAGNVTASSNFAVTGGVLSPTGPSTTQLQASLTANVTFCGGTAVTVTSPLFYNFSTVTWQDRPGGKP